MVNSGEEEEERGRILGVKGKAAVTTQNIDIQDIYTAFKSRIISGSHSGGLSIASGSIWAPRGPSGALLLTPLQLQFHQLSLRWHKHTHTIYNLYIYMVHVAKYVCRFDNNNLACYVHGTLLPSTLSVTFKTRYKYICRSNARSHSVQYNPLPSVLHPLTLVQSSLCASHHTHTTQPALDAVSATSTTSVSFV